VITLPEPRPHLGYWHRGVQFRFPTTDFGRWRQAQRELQEQLGSAIIQRTLPVPRHSWLARERTYLLAGLVHDYGTGRHRRPIRLAELREIVTTWMQTVNTSVRATWRGSGRHVDSDDIRWLSTQLTLQDGEELQPPWPSVDQPHTGKWAWQAYSPELTLTLAEEIVREALIGYRQLVETNFATFGDALGLYSMLPVRVEGLVGRFADEDDASSVEMLLVLHPDPAQRTIDPLRVDLRLITGYHDPVFGSSARITATRLRRLSARIPSKTLNSLSTSPALRPTWPTSGWLVTSPPLAGSQAAALSSTDPRRRAEPVAGA
jgi:hypothetical protein